MRRTFGVTVLAGLAGSGLAAVAGNRAWAASPDAEGTSNGAFAALGQAISDASAPLVTSLALVALAAWGVVLVSRGLFRRIVTVLGLVAAVGMLAAGVGAWLQAPDAVREALTQAGAPEAEVHRTAWSYVALVAALVALTAAAQAVRAVGSWPEMGRRYDAPGDAGSPVIEPEVPLEDQNNLDVWRSIDEGHDPTDRPPRDA